MVDLFRGFVLIALAALDALIKAFIVFIVVLIALRWVLLKWSPFGWAAYRIRQVTDPLLWPFAQLLPVPGSTGMASLLLILVAVLSAYFLKWVVGDVLRALLGMLGGLSSGAFVESLGWILYGTVSVILALIVARIVVSWLPFAREGKIAWFFYKMTEPIMSPFRQIIPPLGMFDLSPIILIFLLHFVQGAILGILIR